jgi:NADPH:quinone reductase-like Zn-dependent oxidoreductase
MSAIRLHAPASLDALALEQVEIPAVGPGEVLVRVRAAAITRGELEWPVDRLPAIPSYELSGTVAALGADVPDLAVGDPVWALTGFDRDGAAAEFTVVPAAFLAPKPHTLGHAESAAIPLAGLTAWQGLFEHGRLRERERVLIHGAAGGVGQFATQLARWRGAYVIGTSSAPASKTYVHWERTKPLTVRPSVSRKRLQPSTSSSTQSAARCSRARPSSCAMEGESFRWPRSRRRR